VVWLQLDSITGFEARTEIIDLRRFGLANFGALQPNVRQVGAVAGFIGLDFFEPDMAHTDPTGWLGM
jgi:hypothetical protein